MQTPFTMHGTVVHGVWGGMLPDSSSSRITSSSSCNSCSRTRSISVSTSNSSSNSSSSSTAVSRCSHSCSLLLWHPSHSIRYTRRKQYTHKVKRLGRLAGMVQLNDTAGPGSYHKPEDWGSRGGVTMAAKLHSGGPLFVLEVRFHAAR